ncbi:hypothetical protein P4C99_21605 [Pontiellaceae bacterium B1224]|nr:hypothetical protein [Pontiellaceae bacterium B1224]
MNHSKMLIFCLLPATALLQAGARPVADVPDDLPLKEQSLTQLEQRLSTIDSTLEQLSNYSLRTGFGSVGYASRTRYTSPKAREWVYIKLDRETYIDQIVLVPSIGRNSKIGFQANAFPLEFTILAGTGSDTNGQIIATFSEQDHLLPRIAPLVVPCSITASWVRVETSILTRRIFDKHYDLKFSEIMIFSGPENVALRRPVQTSSEIRNKYKTQQPRFLTDGLLPFLMDSGRGQPSLRMLGVGIKENAWMSIDLGNPYALNQVNFHSVAPSHTAPLDNQSDYYIPQKMRIEGARQADFSDAKTLIEVQYNSLLDVGPILMHTFPETTCRYVRLTVVDPYIDKMRPNDQFGIGFAEIEQRC